MCFWRQTNQKIPILENHNHKWSENLKKNRKMETRAHDEVNIAQSNGKETVKRILRYFIDKIVFIYLDMWYFGAGFIFHMKMLRS